jgi:hypothetical protein
MSKQVTLILDNKFNIFSENNKTIITFDINQNEQINIDTNKNDIFIRINNLDKIEIIHKKDIYNLIDEFKDTTLIRVFGKGPTFKNIEKTNPNEFHISINQSINFLSECDMLVINDLHNIFLVDIDKIKKLKYILTPEFLHIDGYFNKNGYYQKVLTYLEKNNFKGKYIVYNLRTNPDLNENFIDLHSTISSSNTAIEFICVYLNKFIKKIECYGIGQNGKRYNNLFVGNGNYDEARIAEISFHISKICKKHNIFFCMN